jgi:hypothetical protein
MEEAFAPINRTQLSRDINLAIRCGVLQSPSRSAKFVESNYPREHWAEVKAIFKMNREKLK